MVVVVVEAGGGVVVVIGGGAAVGESGGVEGRDLAVAVVDGSAEGWEDVAAPSAGGPWVGSVAGAIGPGLRLGRVLCGAGGVGVSRSDTAPSAPPMQMKSMPQRSRRMTKRAPLSSWTVTVGGECLPPFRVRTVLPGAMEEVACSEGWPVCDGAWSAQREAATAA